MLTYTDDPIWDGQQCEGHCCFSRKSPPWFSTEVPHITTRDIEVCVFGSEITIREDIPINILE